MTESTRERPMPLAELLLARAPEEVTRELSAIADLEATLQALAETGCASHPDISFGEEAWVGHWARHLVAGKVQEQLANVHANDVHLALGCLAGNARAFVKLDARLREVAPLALSRIRLDRASRDELLQDLRDRLLVVRGGAELPKIALYSGRGALEGWLRVTVARAALTALRDRGSAAPHDDERALLDQVAADDPRLEALKKHCAPALSRAIADAITGLPDGDRVLLRLQVVDGLTIDDLAAVYGAHRATTARRLARVRHRIFEDARARAMATLGVGETEFASLMGLMLSQLDVTIMRLLREGHEVTHETPGQP